MPKIGTGEEGPPLLPPVRLHNPAPSLVPTTLLVLALGGGGLRGRPTAETSWVPRLWFQVPRGPRWAGASLDCGRQVETRGALSDSMMGK